MGVTMEYGHPLTTWVVENVELPIGKTNTPQMKEVPLAPMKKIVTLVLPSTIVDILSLHVYHRIPKRCACSNYDAIPNISETEKTISISDFGSIVQTHTHTHTLSQKKT